MAPELKITLFIPDNFSGGNFLEHYGEDLRKPYHFFRQPNGEFSLCFKSLAEFLEHEPKIRKGAVHQHVCYTILTRIEVVQSEPEAESASQPESKTAEPDEVATLGREVLLLCARNAETPRQTAWRLLALDDSQDSSAEASQPAELEQKPEPAVAEPSGREVELRRWDECKLIAHAQEQGIRVSGGVHNNREGLVIAILSHESGQAAAATKPVEFNGPYDQATLQALDLETLKSVSGQIAASKKITAPRRRDKIVEFIIAQR